MLTLAFIVHGGKGNIRDTAIRDHAFKLRPLALSTDLITQLKACAVKLQHWADVLQSRISKKYNKSKYYRDVEDQVKCLRNLLS